LSFPRRRESSKAASAAEKIFVLAPQVALDSRLRGNDKERTKQAAGNNSTLLALDWVSLYSLTMTNAAAESLSQQGFALYKAGKIQDALETLNQAVALGPNHAVSYLYRGYVHLYNNDWPAVAADFNRAKDLDPANPEIHYQIGRMLHKSLDYFQAIQPLNFAIQCKPDYEAAWELLADCYLRFGSADIARGVYQKMQERFPKNVTCRLEQAYMLPPIIPSNDSIDPLRAQIMHNLDRLMQEYPGGMLSVIQHVKYLPFYQAYHGRNNKELAQKLETFFTKMDPSLAYVAPHAVAACVPKQKIRIGFVLDFLYVSVFAQFVQLLIEGVTWSEEFESVLILSNVSSDDPALKTIASLCPRYLVIPADMKAAHEAVAAEKLDILIYTEVGQSFQNYFLAMAKLAPIQCVLGTHPATSGMESMDYFFSTRGYEPENGQEHYSEKLVLFDRNLAVFKRPAVPEHTLSREQLGLPQGENLYCCPVQPFKLHPDMDTIFGDILKRDPKARIILFDSSYKTLWRPQLEKRFAETLPPQDLARITFLPHASKDVFFQILRQSDAILDTLHYSFGTTAYLTLGANLPFVTLPGEFSRGRGSYMLYKQMGMTDLVASTQGEYIEMALRLASDNAFHAKMAEKIQALSGQIFDDYAIIDEFASCMKELYANTCR